MLESFFFILKSQRMFNEFDWLNWMLRSSNSKQCLAKQWIWILWVCEPNRISFSQSVQHMDETHTCRYLLARFNIVLISRAIRLKRRHFISSFQEKWYRHLLVSLSHCVSDVFCRELRFISFARLFGFCVFGIAAIRPMLFCYKINNRICALCISNSVTHQRWIKCEREGKEESKRQNRNIQDTE